VDVCTYLFFDGDCQEAIDLYVRVLGAELLHLSRFDEAPEFLRPPNGGHLVFHATLKIGSTILNLNDDPTKERGDFGGFALLIHLDREEDVDRLSQGLTQEGRVDLAPVKTMWARRYAVVKDRFGVVWKLQCS
jgi:PhnB protein